MVYVGRIFITNCNRSNPMLCYTNIKNDPNNLESFSPFINRIKDDTNIC